MDYEDILRRATSHIWHHKMLWILGFLASFAGGGIGGGGSSNINSSSSDFPSNFPNNSDFGRWTDNISAVLPLIALVCCLFLLVGIVLYFVGLAARGGLITAVSKIDKGEEITFGESMSIGRKTMFKAFFMRLLLNLPVILVMLAAFIVGIVVFINTITIATSDSSEIDASLLSSLLPILACLMPLICILWVYSIIVQFVEAYAYRGYVLSEMGLMEGVRHGWAIFRANLTASLILGVLVAIASGIFGVLVLIILLPIVLVAVVPFVLTTMKSENPNLVVAIAYLSVIGLSLVILLGLLGSVITAWRSAVFTLAYESFAGGVTIGKEKTPESLGYSPFSGV